MADNLDTADRRKLAKEGDAMKGGRFPIPDKAHLEKAIHAVGRSKGGEAGRRAVRRYIIRRAKALHAEDMIPKTWKPDGTLWTAKSDHKYDRSHGIKQGSPKDKALDKSRGVRD